MFENGEPRAPLPGVRISKRGLFIDRWGTLLELPSAGYAKSVDDVRFRPGALDALFRAARDGWNLYLLGNEEDVAFGNVTDDEWRAIDEAIHETLSDYGVALTRSYACVDHPRGRRGHDNDSVYFLPNTGAFYHAAHTDGIELDRSWVIGDSTLELVAGWRAGLRLASVRTGLGLSDGEYDVEPEFHLADICAVLDELSAAAPATRS
ncbi:MAG: HAD hydrolase-like protein [Planctomycetota bacterium]|jgi:histidinol phosphatase-like enzyme